MNKRRGRGRRPPPEGVTSTLRLDAEASPFRDEVLRTVRAHFRPVLTVLSGERRGVRVTFEGNALVGRDPEAELCLEDAGVSWHHAVLEDRGGSFALVDAGSTNGTAVNGELVDDRELRNGDKLVFGSTIVRFEEQDENDQAYDEFVSRLVSIDDLTGLYLRRRFDQELNQLLTVARIDRQPVGMLVMDLDGVKKINDTHGHAFGAYVIADAGRVIGGVVEGRGIACRWGGDEYLAALRNHDVDATCAVATEIHAAIAAHPFEHHDIPLRPGISIGVATFPENAENAHELFQAADRALYRAKAEGKNRVCR